MNMKHLILLFISSSFILSQCEYDIGDSDNNGILDVIDIVAMVNFIIENDFNSNNENNPKWIFWRKMGT